MGYVIAFIMGIVVATVGFTGIAHIGDKAVNQVQQVTKDAAKWVTLDKYSKTQTITRTLVQS